MLLRHSYAIFDEEMMLVIVSLIFGPLKNDHLDQRC
ncbi:hypothetical protein DA077_07985 [Lactiplantibacillus paraplantarum]|uniref:Uncharacterized protein n=1 Tax=Lactiplantibacillus paraplantarum TaxID=60520 RepID=A0A370AEZ2_9LACO|nr:hypothetical protein DA077_07985 [Lactiplantibacillus paraplantarum]AYJ38722.1 hypothetical protein LP667_07805 [Lactiplantibacillus paraplantarum]MCT4457853.1 hypothetical protein [Lactiplantibacillus paraplantarum]RDG13225.1 hypothetical protein DQM08_02080 [Lactiplantibacillus paraplantarum]TBX42684.1 hypothetical protein EUZ87_08120 [Lactiplantibacillus paraplantarum]